MALNPIQNAAVRHLVAYRFSPPETRMDHKDFCSIIGVTPRTLERWQKDDEFACALDAAVSEAEESRDPFATFARQFAIEQLMALMKKAKTADESRKILKDIMAHTDHVAQYTEPVDYSGLSDDDLISLCLNRGVSPAAMTEAELRRLAEKKAGKRDD